MYVWMCMLVCVSVCACVFVRVCSRVYRISANLTRDEILFVEGVKDARQTPLGLSSGALQHIV
jgi:hypothetical protein